MKQRKRWVVVIDGDEEWYRTRKEARSAQRWLNRHPRNVDIRRFGPYRNVDGIARIYSREDLEAEEA